jgi:hypothetical protein
MTNATNDSSTLRIQVRETLRAMPLKTGVWPVVHATCIPNMEACMKWGSTDTTHYKHMPKGTLINMVTEYAGIDLLMMMEAECKKAKTMIQNGTAEKPIGKPGAVKVEVASHADPMADLQPDVESDILANAIRQIAKQAMPSMDEPAIRKMVKAEVETAMNGLTAPTKVVVKIGDAPEVDCGIQHHRFGDLLKILSARLGNGRRMNVWLHGPAATGKTTAAKSCAEALGLKFYMTGAIETAYAVLGYVDAHGKTVRTPFREAWEHGGVMLFDEADGNHPNASCAINGAVDSSVCAFPDGMIKRHDDCVIVAGANTNGRGGSAKFSGRMKQDSAFLNRWVMLEWAHDDALETALTGSDAIAVDWLKAVRSYRAAALHEKVDGLDITTRASLDGVALLRAGLPKAMVIESVIRKGLPSTSWDRVADRAAVKSY